MHPQPLHLDAPAVKRTKRPFLPNSGYLPTISLGHRGVWAGGAFLFIDLKCRCRTGAQRGLLAIFGHICSHGPPDHRGPLIEYPKHQIIPFNNGYISDRYEHLGSPRPQKRATHVCTSTPYQVMPPNPKLAMFNSGQSWGGDLRNVSSP